jgi:hypothetical protein
MDNTKIETLIVGGGISGLACARTLHDAGKEFLLITKDLGGRIHAETAGGEVPHGTAYMCEDYLHMRMYTDKGSRDKKSASHYFFWNDKEFVSLLSWKNIIYLPKFLKLRKILKKFRQHINAYRNQMENSSLKELFEADEFLLHTWKTPAKDFIIENGFEDIDRIFVNPIVATTTYAESDEINTTYYLGMALPLVAKTWRADFTHTISKLTKGFENRLKIGEVTKITKTEAKSYLIITSVGNFEAKNVVLAAPQKALGHIYPNIPTPHRQIAMHTLNVHGERQALFVDKPVVFLRSHDYNGIYAVFQMKPGVDLVYSKQKNPDLGEFYTDYKIVKSVFWDPAMIVPDNTLIDQKIDNNLYLASDYNISGLEEAFLTGLSAANVIIKS